MGIKKQKDLDEYKYFLGTQIVKYIDMNQACTIFKFDSLNDTTKQELTGSVETKHDNWMQFFSDYRYRDILTKLNKTNPEITLDADNKIPELVILITLKTLFFEWNKQLISKILDNSTTKTNNRRIWASNS